MVPFAGHGEHANLALHVALCLQVGQQVDRLGLCADARRCAVAVAHEVRVVAAAGAWDGWERDGRGKNARP